MRSAAVVLAGLAAVASADPYTVTQTEDVTVTYCAPTVTNCPANNGATWAPVPAKPTGYQWQPYGKPPGNWESWEEVPEDQRTWAEWKAKPTAEWQPYQPKKPYYNKPNQPYGKPPGQWAEWKDVPEAQRTWDEWKAQPTAEWQPYAPGTPAGKPPGGWADWADVPEAQRTWAEWKAQPTAEWQPYQPQKPAGDKPAGKPPGGWDDWKNVPEDQRTWAEWKAQPTAAWQPYEPVKPAGDKPGKPVDATATWNSWEGVTATAACPKYTETAPPEWFKNLPSDVLSSLKAKWTPAPPADWCQYSYKAAPAPADKTGPAASSWAGADVKPTSATGWVAQYTGAANANAGSMAMAGLAGLAAIIIA